MDKTAANSRTPLLRLPAELRNEIWARVIVRKRPIVLQYGSIQRQHKELLSVCRQIRAEASSIYYTENSFIVDRESINEFYVRKHSLLWLRGDPLWPNWLTAIPEVDRCRIRSVKVLFTCDLGQILRKSSITKEGANNIAKDGMLTIMRMIDVRIPPNAITFAWRALPLHYMYEDTLDVCRMVCANVQRELSKVEAAGEVKVCFPDETDVERWFAKSYGEEEGRSDYDETDDESESEEVDDTGEDSV